MNKTTMKKKRHIFLRAEPTLATPAPRTPVLGVALVVVLLFLVLTSAFVLAFFSSVTTEGQAANNYARMAETRQLAESAVNIVMAQLKEATTNGPEIAWSSQPGMLRTFNRTGDLISGYKLYSSDAMRLDGKVDLNAELAAIQDWTSDTAHFIDLNSPVANRDGVPVYPIVHPDASKPASDDAKDQLQGFQLLSNTPVADNNQAPMPVRWLYVLSEGQVVAPTGSGSLAKVAGATAENPIIGRIAFWTDDETCKVNINTAAGDEWKPANASYGAPPAGSYWDIPRAETTYDKAALSKFQPAQGEFQRYPGHPATVYLSAIFPKLTKDQIGTIATRVQKGGSLGGTQAVSAKVVNDTDRLYGSIDELIFDPKRVDQAPISKERLERGRFFLTAHSRAPEINLFNQPRIAVWPVHDDDSLATRTPFDRLIAFCSRLGNENYIFTRRNADSKTEDFVGIDRNKLLYAYLQRLTSTEIPGFGGRFSAKYGEDRDQILTEIFDYIRSTNLFDDNLEPNPNNITYPTRGREYTDSRTTKTSVARGHGQVTPIEIGSTKGFGRFYTLSEIGLQYICTADQAVPASNTTANRTLETKSAGPGGDRIPLIKGQKRVEAMLVMTPFSPSQGWTALRPDMQIRVRGLDTLSVNDTSLGFPPVGTLRQSASPVAVTHGRAWGGYGDFRTLLVNDIGGGRGTRGLPERGVLPAAGNTSADFVYPFISKPITVTGGTMTVPEANLTVEIYTNTAANPDPSEATLVQTIQVKLPGGNFPVPNLITTGTPGSVVDSTPFTVTTAENWWSFCPTGAIAGKKGRMAMVFENPGKTWGTGPESGCLIRTGDTVRTVQVKHADYRIVAGMKNVPADLFAPHKMYTSASARMAHSFRIGMNFGYIQGADDPDGGNSKLVDTKYNWSVQPLIPAGKVTEANIYGDWDTGFSNISDGAYINKPDEGQGGASAYYDSGLYNVETSGPTLFSPNRQVPSAGMFGSLPSQLKATNSDGTRGVGWRTLLFRPDSSGKNHIGARAPTDHLLLDLFWMPMVEPYAISEPFSTSGKINLNYQIAPFTYIERTTALRALLRSERVMAVPTADGVVYKVGKDSGSGRTAPVSYRSEINGTETLKQFQARFDKNDVFRSASELCDLYLVPEGRTLAAMPAFWNSEHRLTGDNARERPYTTLYPRLTTKSNTYSVHLRVQTLQQVNRVATGRWDEWDENRDRVTGEYRGTTIVERYIGLDGELPDFAKAGLDARESLDRYTKLRTVMTRRFAP